MNEIRLQITFVRIQCNLRVEISGFTENTKDIRPDDVLSNSLFEFRIKKKNSFFYVHRSVFGAQRLIWVEFYVFFFFLFKYFIYITFSRQ